jgi:plastocyanin
VRHAALVALALLVAALPAQAAAKPGRFAPKRSASACAAKSLLGAWRHGTSCRARWRRAMRPLPAGPSAPPRAAPALDAPLDAPLDATLAPLPAPDAPPAPVPAPPPAAPACDPSPWLGVVAEDAGGAFRFRLTRTCVPAGTVLFQFRNTDLADHNLWAEGVAPTAAQRQIVETTPGETVVTASATLAAGRWRLFCSIAGHEAMSRLVDVTPAS